MENITGSLIRAEIKKQGRTAKWVGEQLGLSESMMSQRLSGKPQLKYSEIRKIKEILGMPSNWIGLSEEQELSILNLYYNGMEDIMTIAEQTNSTFEQVSELIIYELKNKSDEKN